VKRHGRRICLRFAICL